MGLTTISNIGNIEKKAEDLEHYIYFLEERVNILELKIYKIQHPEEVLQLDDSSWDNIRKKRDYILKSTDWVMTPGSTLDQSQWAAYRQILRDIPQKYSKLSSESVVWPKQPSFAGPSADPVK
jgi:hypothetical protein